MQQNFTQPPHSRHVTRRWCPLGTIQTPCRFTSSASEIEEALRRVAESTKSLTDVLEASLVLVTGDVPPAELLERFRCPGAWLQGTPDWLACKLPDPQFVTSIGAARQS